MNDFERAEQQLAELAARQWWRWRHHYLESLRQPHRAAELRADLSTEQLVLFDETYTSRLVRARMANPIQADIDATVVAQLIAEAEQGRVPLGHGDEHYVLIAPVPLVSPFDLVSNGLGADYAALAQRYRLPILGVAGVCVLLVFWLLFASDPAAQAAHSVPTPVPTPWPTEAPSPLDVGLGAAQQFGDTLLPASVPTSLELGSVVYRVQPTGVRGDTWQVDATPGVASWLRGSTVNLVFCLDGIPDLESGTPIRVWDTTGTVRQFTTDSITEVERHQIDILNQRTTGLTIVACGGTEATRAVLTATYGGDHHE